MASHTYYALYIGAIPIPVGWFFKEHEARSWARIYYDDAPYFDIRPYELTWAVGHNDDRDRPNVFFAAEEIQRPQ